MAVEIKMLIFEQRERSSIPVPKVYHYNPGPGTSRAALCYILPGPPGGRTQALDSVATGVPKFTTRPTGRSFRKWHQLFHIRELNPIPTPVTWANYHVPLAYGYYYALIFLRLVPYNLVIC